MRGLQNMEYWIIVITIQENSMNVKQLLFQFSSLSVLTIKVNLGFNLHFIENLVFFT